MKWNATWAPSHLSEMQTDTQAHTHIIVVQKYIFENWNSSKNCGWYVGDCFKTLFNTLEGILKCVQETLSQVSQINLDIYE